MRLFRILTFRAREEDYAALDARYLALGLILAAAVGAGRHWDNPRVPLLLKTGAGSVAYVFALAALLRVLGAPLCARRWNYGHLATFVALTAPPGLLYALPVERWLPVEEAQTANAVFLGVVAAWRVGMYGQYLVRWVQPGFVRGAVLLLFPLLLIVVALTLLNLERATFDFMGGRRESVPEDGAYEVLSALSLFSLVALPFVFVAYGILALKGPPDRKPA